MIRRILTFSLMMIVVLSLTSCWDFLKSDDEDENPLIGKWIIYRFVENDYEDGVLTDSWDQIYNPDWDNYYYAWIIEFTKDVIYYYENDDGTDYYESEDEYEYKDGKIIVDGDETPFKIQDEYLIIEMGDEDEWDGVTYTWEVKEYYKKYEGDIPPASWVNPLENDTYEDDDDYHSASAITVNADPQSHTITAEDEDWFSFNATSGQNYLIIVGGYIDTWTWLYDTNGSSYLDDDDDNDYDIELNNVDYPVESVLFWSATGTGTYYFKVRGFDDEDEGYYIVSVVETTMTSPFAKAVIADTNKKETRTRHHFLNTK